MSSDDPTTPGTSDSSRAAYEQSEARIAMHKQERGLEATERELEKKLEAFGEDLERTRKAEDAEYLKAHFHHGREVAGEDAAKNEPPDDDDDER